MNTGRIEFTSACEEPQASVTQGLTTLSKLRGKAMLHSGTLVSFFKESFHRLSVVAKRAEAKLGAERPRARRCARLWRRRHDSARCCGTG